MRTQLTHTRHENKPTDTHTNTHARHKNKTTDTHTHEHTRTQTPRHAPMPAVLNKIQDTHTPQKQGGELSWYRRRPGLLPRCNFWSSAHALAPLAPGRFLSSALSLCGVSCMIWRIDKTNTHTHTHTHTHTCTPKTRQTHSTSEHENWN